MKKRLLSILLILILSFTSFTSYAELDINSRSALLMDYATGDIIFAMNEHTELPPASITKIMTLLIVMESIESGKINLVDKVMISEHASRMTGTSVYLDAGEMQSVEDLIRAVAIRSANDASVALGEHIAGSEEAFAKLMNEKSELLGMKNTKFSNASGLPIDNHYSTAYDIALMSKELLKHSRIHDYLTVYMDDMTVGKSKTSVQTMVNTNRLIKDYQGANGIKTGFTNEAKHCISASAKRGDLQLIAVVMGADDSKTRFNEAMRLLDYGFANFESVKIGNKGDIISKVPVEKGKVDYMNLILEEDSYLLLPKGKKVDIEKLVNLPEYLTAPIDESMLVGDLSVMLDGKEVSKINLVTESLAEKGSLISLFKKTLRSFIKGE